MERTGVTAWNDEPYPEPALLGVLVEKALAQPIRPPALERLVLLLIQQSSPVLASLPGSLRQSLFIQYPEAAHHYVLGSCVSRAPIILTIGDHHSLPQILKTIAAWCLALPEPGPETLFPADYIVPPALLGSPPLSQYLRSLLDCLWAVLPRDAFLLLAERMQGGILGAEG